jgi:hypothetical protein
MRRLGLTNGAGRGLTYQLAPKLFANSFGDYERAPFPARSRSMFDAPRVTALRVEIDRLATILQDPEQRPHIIAIAGRRIAELQLDLQELTGEPPSITMADVDAYEAAAREAARRVIAGQVPQFSNQANITGQYRRREPARETELVSSPVEQALQARRVNRAFAAPNPIPLGWGSGGDGGMVYASPTGNLCDNSPVFTKRVHLSGRVAD